MKKLASQTLAYTIMGSIGVALLYFAGWRSLLDLAMWLYMQALVTLVLVLLGFALLSIWREPQRHD